MRLHVEGKDGAQVRERDMDGPGLVVEAADLDQAPVVDDALLPAARIGIHRMDEMLGRLPDLRPGALALQDEAELGGLRGRAVICGGRHGREKREGEKEQSLHHGREELLSAGRMPVPPRFGYPYPSTNGLMLQH